MNFKFQIFLSSIRLAAWMAAAAGFPALAQDADRSGVPWLTNAAQVPALESNLSVRARVPMRLEGTVLLNGLFGTAVLPDGADYAISIAWDGSTPVRRGDRIRFTGSGIIDGTNYFTDPRPLVENDGLHSMIERSGGAWFKAGTVPIRLRYFNRAGDRGLAVSIQGPGFTNQVVPGNWLFHGDTNTPGRPLQPGVEYRVYDGSWTALPDFSSLPARESGVTTHFEIPITSRTDYFGLDFTGFIALPRDGFYIFSCASDDGSTLQVGHSETAYKVVGSTHLPPVRHMAAGQLVGDGPEEFCAALEGDVAYAWRDGETLKLELVNGQGRASVSLPVREAMDPQALMGLRLRVSGLCRRVFTPEGYKVAGQISVPSWEQMQILDAPQRLWDAGILTARQAVGEAQSNSAPMAVRLRGAIGSAGPDYLQFRDGSGTVLVRSQEAPDLSEGAADVLGFARRVGTNVVIADALIRSIVDSPNGEPVPTLISVQQVKRMSREEARRGYPVKVRGVITFVWPDNGFFLQDGTGSIDVQMPPTVVHSFPRIGDFWEVEGETFAEFAPNIRAEHATLLGPGSLPNVVHPNWGQLVDGSLDAQFVEVQGVVSSATNETLSLLTRGGRINVQLQDMDPSMLGTLEGALVRISGCLIPGRDIDTQRVKLGVFALRAAAIAVDDPAPKDPFQSQIRHANDLLLFDSHTSPIQRTHLEGVLIQQVEQTCFLMEGTNGFRAILKSPEHLQRGDLLEVVGFPDLNGPSPALHDAVVKTHGPVPLPRPVELANDAPVDGRLDATRVQVNALLTGWRHTEKDQVLEMRSGQRLWLARLPLHDGVLPALAIGSKLRLTGLYTGQGGDRSDGRGIDSFEVLLHSPLDILVLAKPSWWTARHALTLAGALMTVLLLASIWISTLHRKVEQRTVELKQEIEDHKRTELQLEEKTRMLTREIEERVRMEAEVERGHKQLLVTSRLAGMAEVATSVLHNVGNVMTGVNVLGSSIVEHVRKSKISSLARLGELLSANQNNLQPFLTNDERGRKLPDYVQKLGSHLTGEQAELLDKVKVLNESIHHINEIVAMQQDYAKVSGVLETLSPEDVVQDSLRMHGESLKRHRIALETRFALLPVITVDRHKVLQILFNLLENAKHAVLQQNPPEKKIVVTLEPALDDMVRITVADNGMGIPSENLSRIFGQGFSTRKDGHGFGLHSSALAAQDLGGRLTAQSEGTGLGATFYLEIPIHPKPRSGGDGRANSPTR
ncbi:MAG TPA: ATP-binding protein [Verrucomicrobiae bacterium]|jgi:signal transduction histidine kinase/uncharacterized protein YdeI (BOF family)|nr:ATP-binding protein [Verrucomicrobiae bacterium]